MWLCAAILPSVNSLVGRLIPLLTDTHLCGFFHRSTSLVSSLAYIHMLKWSGIAASLTTTILLANKNHITKSYFPTTSSPTYSTRIRIRNRRIQVQKRCKLIDPLTDLLFCLSLSRRPVYAWCCHCHGSFVWQQTYLQQYTGGSTSVLTSLHLRPRPTDHFCPCQGTRRRGCWRWGNCRPWFAKLGQSQKLHHSMRLHHSLCHYRRDPCGHRWFGNGWFGGGWKIFRINSICAGKLGDDTELDFHWLIVITWSN